MFDREPEFARRFSTHEDELRWLYCELYHNDTKAWDYFSGMLYRSWKARPEALKRLDRKREADPTWYAKSDRLGMQVYAENFAGNFKGIIDKLDYIQECGFDFLHLMPFLESPFGKSDGGYAVSDYRKVQPNLGTMEDLFALTEACHARDIAVCADFVMNHTSDEHEWAKRARAGEASFQRRYFMYDNWEIPKLFEQTVPEVFPTTAPGNFTWCEQAGKVVMTSFHPFQWDLNYADPVVFNDMTDNMLYLCNHGIDVIRLDAVPYIWKQLGSSCRNLPQVHTLVRMLRMVCEIVCPGTLLLGEVVMEPKRVVPYFGTVAKPECHMLYNVTTMATLWHTVATRDTRLLKFQMEQVLSLPRQYVFLNYVRCHDDIGWGLDYGMLTQAGWQEVPHKRYLNDYFTGKWPGSPARGALYNDDPELGDARLCGTTASLAGIESAEKEHDDEALDNAIRLDVMLHAFILTLDGLPVLYSGDEIAQINDNSYADDPVKADDSRYLHRGAFPWDRAEQRHDRTTTAGRVFQELRALERFRAGHAAFGNEAHMRLLETRNDHVLAIERSSAEEELLAFFNFGDERYSVSLERAGLWKNALTGAVCGDLVLIPARGFVWLTSRVK